MTMKYYTLIMALVLPFATLHGEETLFVGKAGPGQFAVSTGMKASQLRDLCKTHAQALGLTEEACYKTALRQQANLRSQDEWLNSPDSPGNYGERLSDMNVGK